MQRVVLSASLINAACKDWMTLENMDTEMPLNMDFAQLRLPAAGGRVCWPGSGWMAGGCRAAGRGAREHMIKEQGAHDPRPGKGGGKAAQDQRGRARTG